MTKDKIKQNFKSNAKTLRKDKTQTEFAKDLGISRQCYAAIEEGRSATLAIAVKISEVTGFTLDAIIKTII